MSGTILAPNETRGGIVSVLKQEINKYLVTSNLLNLLCTNKIDLSEIKDKIALFVFGNTSYNKLSNVVLEQINMISETNNIKFNIILDNFSSLNKIYNVEDFLDLSKNNIFVIDRDEEKIKEYNVMNKFDVIETTTKNEEIEYDEIKCVNEYPVISKINHTYFDIANLKK